MNALYNTMERFRPFILSILRIVVGLLFLEHGLSKGFGFPAASPVASLSGLLLLAAFLETVGAVLFRPRRLHADRGVHPVRPNGLRLFHGACSALVLPACQRGGTGDPLLLRLPLFRLCRRGPGERRPRDAEAGVRSPRHAQLQRSCDRFDARRQARVLRRQIWARAHATSGEEHERQRTGHAEPGHDFGPHRPAAGDAHDLEDHRAAGLRHVLRALRPLVFRLCRAEPGQVRSAHRWDRGSVRARGVASFIAALFTGLFIGTLLCGFLADRFGRRAIFTWSLLWYSAANVMVALQHDAAGLNFWRLISGVGLGVEIVTIGAYLSEIAPKGCAGAPSPSTRRSASSACRSSRSWPICSCRPRPWGSRAGAGWC